MNKTYEFWRFQKEWLMKLESFDTKLKSANNEHISDLASIDVEDLVYMRTDDSIKMNVARIIANTEIKSEETVEQSHDVLQEKLEQLEIKESTPKFIKECKENIEILRKESISLALLLKNVDIPHAQELEETLKNVPLLSNKHKEKIVPLERNYFEDPIKKAKVQERTQMCNVETLVPINEIIVQVCVYNSITKKKQNEFLVLGSQRLTELKDKIYCTVDLMESQENEQGAGGFFFIENVFYNDTRSPSFEDYSKKITENQQKKLRFLKKDDAANEIPFESRKMQDVFIRDLKVHIAKRYVYRHHGVCDHIIVFTDIRLATESDARHLESYPLNIFFGKNKRKKCDACGLYFAKFMCLNDKIHKENPSYYCQECYTNLHLDEEGKAKFKDFYVYPYFHD